MHVIEIFDKNRNGHAEIKISMVVFAYVSNKVKSVVTVACARKSTE